MKKFFIEQVLLLKSKDNLVIGDPFVEKVKIQTKILNQVRDKKNYCF